jgi:hypothetical protein
VGHAGYSSCAPLALYRRHRRECKGQHPHNLRTSEYDERTKGWKRCEGPIFASGSLGKHFKNRSSTFAGVAPGLCFTFFSLKR